MKRINDIVTINNLLDCYYDIKKNTKNKEKLVKYDMFISSNIINLYNKLINGKYRHGIYNIFLIYEPKLRVIMSENINDKIVSHLICKYYLVDIIDKKLINSNVATRKNMGSSYGIKLIKKYINSVKLKHNKFYILKIDIKKYFFNIDHDILLNKLYSIVGKDIFNIIENIVDSTNKEYVNDSNKLVVKVKNKNKVRIRRKLKYLKKYDIDKYKVVVNSYKGYFVVRNRQKCQKN